MEVEVADLVAEEAVALAVDSGVAAFTSVEEEEGVHRYPHPLPS